MPPYKLDVGTSGQVYIWCYKTETVLAVLTAYTRGHLKPTYGYLFKLNELGQVRSGFPTLATPIDLDGAKRTNIPTYYSKLEFTQFGESTLFETLPVRVREFLVTRIRKHYLM